ncbi:MAG: SBBP repeat-containing protein [Flavipsychrobacter sp.]|nr:SBBP repeat-containing protein [Flavipsychrobacter sp.]
MKRYLLSALVAFLSLTGIAREGDVGKIKGPGLSFLENNGQLKDEIGRTRNDIDFSLKGNGVDVFVSPGGLSYQWSQPGGEGEWCAWRMDIKLVGANPAALVETEGKQSFTTRFYREGNNIVANSWRKVTYREVYKGIDWILYIKDGQMEYDFVVKEGADPSQIQLAYEGDVMLTVEPDGGIVARTPQGMVKQQRPVSFTTDGQEVASAYRLTEKTLRFDVGDYNGTLVIDPVLVWGTYYGGSESDHYTAVKTDDFGNVYAAGVTSSATGISTNNTTYQAYSDGMVSKFNIDGELIWSTYCGTAGNDVLLSLVVDGGNGVYVIGRSDTAGNSIAWDVYIAKLDTQGNMLHTRFMGGPGPDHGYGISKDPSGNIYICGSTQGWTENTTGCYQSVYGGGQVDGFVAKLDSQLNTQWCTYYGGSDNDAMIRIAAQPAGKIYVAGASASPNNIATVGTSQTSVAGGIDAVIARFDANTGVLDWGTYLGGPQLEEAMSIGFDGAGSVYICGYTNSPTGIATTGAQQGTLAGGEDGFLAKYDANGVVQWSTYYGTNQADRLQDLQVTSHSVIVAGFAGGIGLDVTNGFQLANNGFQDGIVAKYNKNTGLLTWGTYYGGSNTDALQGVATDFNDNIYVAGSTSSTANISLNTNVQATFAGNTDGFVARINDCYPLSQPSAITGNDTICAGTVQTYSIPQVQFSNLYVWTKPSGWTGNSFSETATFTTGTTSGPVTVYAYNNCDTTAVISLYVVVNPLPATPVVSQAGNVLSTGVYASYQWYLNGVLIPGATSATHTATQGGTYQVVVTDTNGCSATSANLPVSASLLQSSNTLQVYPNPHQGRFSVRGTLPAASGAATMRILDVTGRVVQQEEIRIENGQLDYEVNMAPGTAQGTYFIQLSTDMGHYSVLLRKE